MFCAGATDVAKISLGIPGTVEVLPSILYSIFSAIFYAILSGFVEGHFTPYFGLLGRALHVWLDPVLDCLALKPTHKKLIAYFRDPEYADSGLPTRCTGTLETRLNWP